MSPLIHKYTGLFLVTDNYTIASVFSCPPGTSLPFPSIIPIPERYWYQAWIEIKIPNDLKRLSATLFLILCSATNVPLVQDFTFGYTAVFTGNEFRVK